MKTKHLLTALALPAIFAACTADDIVNESANQAQRVALNENFKMNFGGVESRLDAGAPGAALKFEYEEGDMVGSAIIDQYLPGTGKTLDQMYQVVEWASTNQPWTFDGSEWTINHTMVEGKYLFYYPYNDANNSRGPVQYSIPVMQELSDKTTGEFNPKAAIEKYSMAIGYQFIKKDDLVASSELAPIFAYARIVAQLDNAYAGGEVEKVVLQASSADFKIAGQLDHKGIETIFKASVNDENFKWSNYNKTAQFELAAPATPVSTGSSTTVSYYDEKLNITSPVLVGKVPAGVSLTSNAQGIKSFETYMVVPAQTISATAAKPLTAYLYMTDGRVFSGNITTTTEFKCNVAKKLTFVMTPASTGATEIIAAEKDWNEAVSKVTKDGATFIIADPDFAITNEMKYPEEGTITINGKLAVSGNNVTMKNVAPTTIIVAKDAKLTTDVTVVATEIINEGEVVVAKNPEARAIKPYSIGTITNKNILTINKDAEIATILTNKKGAKVVNNGKYTILSGSNYGAIENNASIYVSGAFENAAREYKTIDGESVLVNEPKINNAATGSIRTNAASAELKNNSVLTNAGILSVANSAGEINNATAGEIDAKASSTTFISKNSGKVVVYSMKQADLSIENQAGIVEYEATAASVDTDESIVTNIVATKDVTIKLTDKTKAGKFNYLTTKADAKVTLTWPAGETLPTIGLNVKAGKTILATSITVNELIIAEGASVSIPEKVVLTLDGEALTAGTGANTYCTNEGTISVVGTLVAQSYDGSVEKVGQYDDNGKGTFDWADTAEEAALKAAKKAYEDAVEPALKEWIEGSFTNTWGIDFDAYKFNLNDSTTMVELDGTKYYGTAEAFGAFVNAVGTNAEYAKIKSMYEKFNAYKLLNSEAKILDNYAAAVTSYISSLKETTNYKNDMKTFKKITVSPNSKNFFVETKRKDKTGAASTDNVTVSAEENAFIAFQAEIAISTLNNETKMVLNASADYDAIEDYVPAYSYAFEADNVYKIYKDYIVKYNITGPSTNNLETLQLWISNRANWTETELASKTAGEKKLYNFISGENFKVYDESLEWKYTDATIAEIASKAAGN